MGLDHLADDLVAGLRPAELGLPEARAGAVLPGAIEQPAGADLPGKRDEGIRAAVEVPPRRAGAAAQTACEDLRPERRVERRVSGGVPLVGGRLLQRRGRLDFWPAGKADPDEVVEAAGLEAHGEG